MGPIVGGLLGPPDGDKLALGIALGAGLLLGTVLGMSVGQGKFSPFGDGVLDACLQMPRCVIAVGPNKNTSSRDTKGTSRTTFLNELGPSGETANDFVAPVEAVT